MDLSTLLLNIILSSIIAYVSSRLIRFWLQRRKIAKLRLLHLKSVPFLESTITLLRYFRSIPGIPRSVHSLEIAFGLKIVFQDQDFFWISTGPFNYVVLLTPSAVEVLLSDKREVNKSDDYDVLRAAVGDGVFTSNYPKWKKQRRILSPGFHSSNLNDFQLVMNECGQTLANRLQLEVGKSEVDLDSFLSQCTLEIIAGTAIGVDLGFLKTTIPELLGNLQRGKAIAYNRMISPWLWSDHIFNLTAQGKKYKEYVAMAKDVVIEAIAIKKKEMGFDERMTKDNQNISRNGGKRLVFSEILLTHNLTEAEDHFTDEDLVDEILTFLIAGLDTSSSALLFAFYLLGLYPEAQAKVQEELDGIFGDDSDRPVTNEDLKQMHYITRVIKETLRLYSPSTFFSRKLQEDFTINGVTFPKGLTLMVFPSLLHMDPESFPNPVVFDPDRFLKNDRHPFSYIPFSAGPRNCLGPTWIGRLYSRPARKASPPRTSTVSDFPHTVAS